MCDMSTSTAAPQEHPTSLPRVRQPPRRASQCPRTLPEKTAWSETVGYARRQEVAPAPSKLLSSVPGTMPQSPCHPAGPTLTVGAAPASAGSERGAAR